MLVRVQLSSPTPVPDRSRLLRYRFDTPGDLYRHVRVRDGFFVPGLALAGDPGERVIVEVEFSLAAGGALLHGEILERTGSGTWLFVRGARTTTRWSPGAGGRERHERRVGCDLFAELRLRDAAPWVCRVADLSRHGLRVTAAAIELGLANDELEVVLLPAEEQLSSAVVHVRLAWAGARDAGLQIVRADEKLVPILDAAEARWESAPAIVHEAACVCAAPVRRAG